MMRRVLPMHAVLCAARRCTTTAYDVPLPTGPEAPPPPPAWLNTAGTGLSDVKWCAPVDVPGATTKKKARVTKTTKASDKKQKPKRKDDTSENESTASAQPNEGTAKANGKTKKANKTAAAKRSANVETTATTPSWAAQDFVARYAAIACGREPTEHLLHMFPDLPLPQPASERQPSVEMASNVPDADGVVHDILRRCERPLPPLDPSPFANMASHRAITALSQHLPTSTEADVEFLRKAAETVINRDMHSMLAHSVVGADECGVGCMAGPLVAAAAYIDPEAILDVAASLLITEMEKAGGAEATAAAALVASTASAVRSLPSIIQSSQSISCLPFSQAQRLQVASALSLLRDSKSFGDDASVANAADAIRRAAHCCSHGGASGAGTFGNGTTAPGLPRRPPLRYHIVVATPGFIDGVGNVKRVRMAALSVAVRAVTASVLASGVTAVSDNQPLQPVVCLDGAEVPADLAGEAVVGVPKADALLPSCAAASILCKAYRDQYMMRCDGVWPEYGFAAHKGYVTGEHTELLQRHGPAPVHRRSVRTVAEVIAASKGKASKAAKTARKKRGTIARAGPPRVEPSPHVTVLGADW